jgi:hypothetical protein
MNKSDCTDGMDKPELQLELNQLKPWGFEKNKETKDNVKSIQ